MLRQVTVFRDTWIWSAFDLADEINACVVQVNSALHPPGSLNRVPASDWGQGRKVTAVGWKMTLCDPTWHVISRSGVLISMKLIYPRYFAVKCFSESSYERIIQRLLHNYDKTVPPSTSMARIYVTAFVPIVHASFYLILYLLHFIHKVYIDLLSSSSSSGLFDWKSSITSEHL